MRGYPVDLMVDMGAEHSVTQPVRLLSNKLATIIGAAADPNRSASPS
jgi:hypothetical protein